MKNKSAIIIFLTFILLISGLVNSLPYLRSYIRKLDDDEERETPICTYEEIIGDKCENKFMSLTQIDEVKNYLLRGPNNNRIIKTQNIIIQFSTMQSQLESNLKDLSSIDFDSCEATLKQKNSIPQSESLLLFKADITTKDNQTPYVLYEVFRLGSTVPLNLNDCSNKIIINTPINFNEEMEKVYKSLTSENIDIFNSKEDFYQDICFKYTTKDETDITLDDRRKLYYKPNEKTYMCQTGCKFDSYNYDTNKAKCTCNISSKSANNLNENELFEKKNIDKDFYDKVEYINFKVMKCVEEVFNSDYKENIGSFILIALTALVIGFNVFSIITCQKKINFWINVILRRPFAERPFENPKRDPNKNMMDNNNIQKAEFKEDIYDIKKNNNENIDKKEDQLILNLNKKEENIENKDIKTSQENKENNMNNENIINEENKENIEVKENNEQNLIEDNKDIIENKEKQDFTLNNNDNNINVNENNNLNDNENKEENINLNLKEESNNDNNINNDKINEDNKIDNNIIENNNNNAENNQIIENNNNVENNNNNIENNNKIAENNDNNLNNNLIEEKNNKEINNNEKVESSENKVNENINNSDNNQQLIDEENKNTDIKNSEVTIKKKKTKKKKKKKKKAEGEEDKDNFEPPKRTNSLNQSENSQQKILNESNKNGRNNNMKINMKSMDGYNNSAKDGKSEEKLDEENKRTEILENEESINNLSNYELDNLNYKQAIGLDKRTYLAYYWSLCKRKQLLLFAFWPEKDLNVFTMKLVAFISCVGFCFGFNGFFYGEKLLHKIYEDKGTYKFLKHLPYMIYSTIVAGLLSYLIRLLTLSENEIYKMKQNKENKNDAEQKAKKWIKIKFIIFFVVTIVIMLFFCYFITCFCGIFTNTQVHWIIDSCVTFGFCMVYPFILNLLPGAFRIPSLRAKNKNESFIYEISLYIAYI